MCIYIYIYTILLYIYIYIYIVSKGFSHTRHVMAHAWYTRIVTIVTIVIVTIIVTIVILVIIVIVVIYCNYYYYNYYARGVPFCACDLGEKLAKGYQVKLETISATCKVLCGVSTVFISIVQSSLEVVRFSFVVFFLFLFFC